MQRAVRCHCSATAQPQARFRPYITERQPPAKRAALAAGALLSALQLACVPHADAKPNFILGAIALAWRNVQIIYASMLAGLLIDISMNITD